MSLKGAISSDNKCSGHDDAGHPDAPTGEGLSAEHYSICIF